MKFDEIKERALSVEEGTQARLDIFILLHEVERLQKVINGFTSVEKLIKLAKGGYG